MCTMKYTAVFLMLWAYISAGGPGSCLDTWHHGFYQIPTDKKSISDYVSHVWIFQPYNNPNTNLKNNTKMGH